MTQERTLHLYGNISAETVVPILEEIIRINNEDELLYHQAETKNAASLPRQPIHLYISSGGGSMYDANVLISAMVSSKTPIYTYAYGYVMSAGLSVFLAGHFRIGGQYATFMTHQPAEELGKDRLFVLENRLEETRRLMDIRIKYICNRTKLTPQDFEDNKFIDWFMDSQKALEKGIIHEIMSARKLGFMYS